MFGFIANELVRQSIEDNRKRLEKLMQTRGTFKELHDPRPKPKPKPKGK